MHRRVNVLHIYSELQFNAVFVLFGQLKKREVTTNLQSILYNAAPYNLKKIFPWRHSILTSQL